MRHVEMTTHTLKIGVITLFYRKYKNAREFLTETVGFAFIGKTFALALCVYNCVSLGFMLHLSFARGGGGVTQQSFIREGSSPRSNPLPFYIPFLTEKVPLSYTFH